MFVEITRVERWKWLVEVTLADDSEITPRETIQEQLRYESKGAENGNNSGSKITQSDPVRGIRNVAITHSLTSLHGY